MPRLLTIAALGDIVRIDLTRLTDADAHAVEDAWRDASVPPSPPESSATEGADAGIRDEPPTVVALDGVSREAMLSDLSQRVTLAAIERARGRLWMLHAAGVALEDGRVVAFIGPSGRGKTTASCTLGRHHGYVSDETVAIAPDGAVLPYRKPLSVIEDPAAPKAQRAPSDLGLLPLPDVPLRLAAIVLLDRDPEGPDEPVIATVDLGDALAELVAQTSYLPALAEPLRTVAAHADAVGGILRVTYREAQALVPVVSRLADLGVAQPTPCPPAPGASSSPGAPSPPGIPPAPLSVPALHGPFYTRTDTIDAIDIDDPERVALLHVAASGDGLVQVIAGVAPTLWRAADGVTITQLTDAAVHAHGVPEGMDAAAAVSAAVEELVAADVLEVVEHPVWTVTDAVAWVDSGDRAVVLDLDDVAVAPKALEGPAALIWFAVATGGTVEEIVARVAEGAETDAVQIEPDVLAFLARLRQEGWIRPLAARERRPDSSLDGTGGKAVAVI